MHCSNPGGSDEKAKKKYDSIHSYTLHFSIFLFFFLSCTPVRYKSSLSSQPYSLKFGPFQYSLHFPSLPSSVGSFWLYLLHFLPVALISSLFLSGCSFTPVCFSSVQFHGERTTERSRSRLNLCLNPGLILAPSRLPWESAALKCQSFS